MVFDHPFLRITVTPYKNFSNLMQCIDTNLIAELLLGLTRDTRILIVSDWILSLFTMKSTIIIRDVVVERDCANALNPKEISDTLHSRVFQTIRTVKQKRNLLDNREIPNPIINSPPCHVTKQQATFDNELDDINSTSIDLALSMTKGEVEALLSQVSLSLSEKAIEKIKERGIASIKSNAASIHNSRKYNVVSPSNSPSTRRPANLQNNLVQNHHEITDGHRIISNRFDTHGRRYLSLQKIKEIVTSSMEKFSLRFTSVLGEVEFISHVCLALVNVTNVSDDFNQFDYYGLNELCEVCMNIFLYSNISLV